MKILYIIYDDPGNPWCGGGGALRVRKVNEHLAKEHEITVITGNYPEAENEIVDGVRYVRIGIKSSYILSRLSFSFLIPFYLKKNGSDIVVNECSFFAPCFADIYTKRPVVNVIHHLMGKHSFQLYPFFGFYPYIVEKVFFKIVKNVITPAKTIRQEIQKITLLKNSANIANGVAEDYFALSPEEGRFILFLGRIDIYMKGIDILIKAFSRLKIDDISLKIAGGGKKGDVQRTKMLIKEFNKNGEIEFLGKVTEQEKMELMRTCMFLVMPSRFEGWGITAVEANASAKPVLGTNIKGLSEAVVNNETAILVEPENVEHLTTALTALINDTAMRSQLGKKGRKQQKRRCPLCSSSGGRRSDFL